MWKVDKFAIQKTRLDLSSSGQAAQTVTQIIVDGCVLANAVELIDWDLSAAQLLVCESCGFPKCEPGAWLALRRIANRVLFIPAFSKMLENEKEYGPPPYLKKFGVPWLGPETYKNLQSQLDRLPAFDSILSPSGLEFACLLQHEAPMKILGRFPQKPMLRHSDMILGSLQGDAPAYEQKLNKLLSDFYEDAAELLFTRLKDDDNPITFLLDGPQYQEWTPMVITSGGNAALHIAPGFCAAPAPISP